MSTQYEIMLKMNSLKEVKTALGNCCFYLTLYSGEELVEVTPSRDLLFDDAPFLLAPEQPLDRIEVWNYNKQKKTGSLMIKKQLVEHSYAHDFKNAHLRVELKAQPIKDKLSAYKRLDSSHSTNSDLSEESL